MIFFNRERLFSCASVPGCATTAACSHIASNWFIVVFNGLRLRFKPRRPSYSEEVAAINRWLSPSDTTKYRFSLDHRLFIPTGM